MAQTTLPIVKLYESIIPTLQERHEYTNRMAVPKVLKVVVNMGVGEAREDSKVLDKDLNELASITLQRPVITSAKKSSASSDEEAYNLLDLLGMPFRA